MMELVQFCPNLKKAIICEFQFLPIKKNFYMFDSYECSLTDDEEGENDEFRIFRKLGRQ